MYYNREDKQDIEEVGLSLSRTVKLFELLSCLGGSYIKNQRTDDIAEVFELIADYLTIIRGDVEAIIDKKFPNSEENAEKMKEEMIKRRAAASPKK